MLAYAQCVLANGVYDTQPLVPAREMPPVSVYEGFAFRCGPVQINIGYCMQEAF